jgi:uncharacterized membrane protein
VEVIAMQRQQLRHQPDPHAQTVSRVATVVLVVAFAGWLAWFGVTAPWDLGGKTVDAAEFFGRFFGLLLLLGVIFAPLAIAAAGGRRGR